MISWTITLLIVFGAIVPAILYWLEQRRRKPKEKALAIDDYEPIQKYDRFPEPKPMRTIETRDGPEPPF